MALSVIHVAHNIAVLCGVASHFGEAKVQNYEGEAIVDVIDEAKPYDHTSRGYMSNKRLPFHSDGADIVGLLCLRSRPKAVEACW